MNRPRPSTRFAELTLAGIAACWGLTFTVVQDAIRTIPPVTFVAFRFLIAAAAVGAVYAPAMRRLTRRGCAVGALLGVILFGGYISQTIGLEYTSAANAGFITGLSVALTPLLGKLIFRHRATGWTWCCVGSATFGLYLLSGPGGSWHPLGDTLVLLCSLSFAAHILATDRAVAWFPVGPLVAVELTVCGLMALTWSAAAGEVVVPRGEVVWSALLFTSLVASAAAFFVQSRAQRHASPTRTALILATEPAFAGVFGYLIAGDRFSTIAWLGAVIMVISILMMEARKLLTSGDQRAMRRLLDETATPSDWKT